MTKTNRTDLISIVIPTYNRCHYISVVISSYLKQKHLGEIIIIDDASTDKTYNLCRKLEKTNPHFKYIRMSERKGAGYLKYFGASKASYDYVLFGEDDVILDIDYTEKLLQLLKRQEFDCCAVSGEIKYLSADSFRNNKLCYSNNFHKKKSIISIVSFTHALFLVRKSNIKCIPFDSYYRGNGWREETDIQMALRMTTGLNIISTMSTLCFHLPRSSGGQHEMSRIRYELSCIRNNCYFLKKFKKLLKDDGFFLLNIMFLSFIIDSLKRLLYNLPTSTLIKYLKYGDKI